MERAARAHVLDDYRRKRDFSRTSEPRGETQARPGAPRFVVQRHWARRDHFDFRLEIDGVLKSWAVTRGPSARPAAKRLAVRTEDHPLDYAAFEGVIPQGEYGGGTVQIWDRGAFEPLSDDPSSALDKGMLKVRLHGERMKGAWALVRMKPRSGETRENWLLVKDRDEHSERDDTLAQRHETSVASGLTRSEIEGGAKPKRTLAKAGARDKSKPRKARLSFAPPQLCELRATPPDGADWLHEMKYDGYRLQIVLEHGAARVFTREGHDWTQRFAGLRGAAQRLPAEDAILDGEAVVFDDRGLSDFPALVAALKEKRGGIVFVAFDLLHLDGEDLRDAPLLERKQRLKALLSRTRGREIIYAEHVIGGARAFFQRAIEGGAEGVVSKRAHAPYRSGRNASWVKVKSRRREDVTIIGYTPSDRGRAFASLAVAREHKGRFIYAGRVGTGFDARTQADIMKRLAPLARKEPPAQVENLSQAPRGLKWVEPGLIVEVAMAGWTGDGQVRQGAFLGVREDRADELEAARKRAAGDSKATKSAAKKKPTKRSPAKIATSDEPDFSRLTHPERVMYPQAGVTKRDIAEYLTRVAPLMFAHLRDRPVSFVRAPDGVEGERFFQRHPLRGMSRGLIPVPGGRGRRDYLAIGSVEGLVTCAQFGVLEIHGWGARASDIEKPDRIVFDLDPDEDLPFASVKEGARTVRSYLKAAGLESFVMASGGKGLHVVAPLAPVEEWPVIEAFCKAFATQIARQDPARFVALMSKARRKGRIFIDYLRNKRSATAIMPYSLRARPEASIAMPLAWSDLARLKSANAFRMNDALARRRDPWSGFFDLDQKISQATLEIVRGRKG